MGERGEQLGSQTLQPSPPKLGVGLGHSTATTNSERQVFATFILKDASWEPLFNWSSKKEPLLCLQGRESNFIFSPRNFLTLVHTQKAPEPFYWNYIWAKSRRRRLKTNKQSISTSKCEKWPFFLKVSIPSDRKSVKEPEPWQVVRASRRDSHTSTYEKWLQRKSLYAWA